MQNVSETVCWSGFHSALPAWIFGKRSGRAGKGHKMKEGGEKVKGKEEGREGKKEKRRDKVIKV